MKLTDKAFTKGATSTKPATKKLDKKALREALSPTASAEAVFDQIAQLTQQDIMAPAMGAPQPQPQKKLSPIHEGMWMPRDIKKHYRKLRSMGYGINDADMAVEDIIRQGAGGAGAEDDRVKDYFRRLWYATISTKPHEESLYKLASDFRHPLEKISGAILAGGAVRNFIGGLGDPKDYDYFFTSEDARKTAITSLELAGATVHSRVAAGGVIYNLNGSLIDITPVIDKPRNIMAGFDITANQCYAVRNSVYALESAVEAIQTRTIKLANVHYPTSTLRRIESLGERYGFVIDSVVLDNLKHRASTELVKAAQAQGQAVSPSSANLTPAQMKSLGIVPSGAPCPYTGFYNCFDPSCPEVNSSAPMPSGDPCPHTGLYTCTDSSCPLFDQDNKQVLAPVTMDMPCECGVDKIGGGIHSDWCPKAMRSANKLAQEMPMPPAAPGGDAPPDMGAPEAPPEDLMAPEPEMSLSEALQQLEESAQAVVEKVQNGEMLDATGQELELELPADTGATPAPAPKIAQAEVEAAPSSIDKVRDTHGDEIADLLRMRDEASDMYNDERLRDRLPRGILNKLERSFKDWNVLTPAEFQEAYAAMKGGQRNKVKPPAGIQQKSPEEMKVPSKPLVPGSAPKVKSKAEDRELIKQMIEKMKTNLPKVSVDQDAKDYWNSLFGEYGDQLTEDSSLPSDRLANVVDAAESIFGELGMKLDNDKFNKIVAFVADDAAERGSVYSLAAELARRDNRFASVVDGLLLNYIAKTASAYNEYPAFTKASMFVLAMHDAGSTDRVMSYIAQKMKTPKPAGQSDDAVEVDAFDTDEASDSEPAVRSEHIKFDYSDPTIRGNYTYMTINWDSSEDSAKMRSEEGLKHAVISYVKGLESKKEFIDWGFLGRIHFSEFDSDAGMAEVYFRASKGGDAVQEVETT